MISLHLLVAWDAERGSRISMAAKSECLDTLNARAIAMDLRCAIRIRRITMQCDRPMPYVARRSQTRAWHGRPRAQPRRNWTALSPPRGCKTSVLAGTVDRCPVVGEKTYARDRRIALEKKPALVAAPYGDSGRGSDGCPLRPPRASSRVRRSYIVHLLVIFLGYMEIY
ncbi:hypothetical protein BV20DRAFT_42939 [Pilatotrama ljubarskyi]|nr:hypothetical protein BV20DRAFT_42939 [Pilatotrama ljubarskyi]